MRKQKLGNLSKIILKTRARLLDKEVKLFYNRDYNTDDAYYRIKLQLTEVGSFPLCRWQALR
jgi:hypothetical protein